MNEYLEYFPKNLQKQLQNIISILSKHTSRAYLVGGCVRDIFLHRAIRDIDIEVYDIAPNDFDILMRRIGACGVGESFFVYKYGDLDLSLPRVERKNGVGHQAFVVENIQDEKEASKRRDFSMNALMLNLFDGSILDFWGGLNALESKTIQFIDEKAFREDSLRVLRAVQFAARFDFVVDINTLEVMRQIELKDLSKTRIFWELEKFFGAAYLHVGLHYFFELGLFQKIFGLHVEASDIEKMRMQLQNMHKEPELCKYYLLYIIAGVLDVDIKNLLHKIEAPRVYRFHCKNQIFILRPSDTQLREIAIFHPIQKWLGNYQDGVKKRAIELGIFDQIYTGGIDIQDVIKDGFSKDAIRTEYERRVRNTIL